MVKLVCMKPQARRFSLHYLNDKFHIKGRGVQASNFVLGVKGAGGSEVDFHFFLFLIVKNSSYQELFTEWKKYCS